jgi:amino acid transporter
LLGGKWLGAVVAIGGMASALGLYSAVLLSVSRIPKAMSDDNLLPAKLHALHPRYNSPYISILCCSVVVSFMVVWTFGELLIIDITLYGAALLLEYVALIRLRKIASGEHRPFKIPLPVPGLIIMALLPFSVYVIALTAAFIDSGETLKPVLFAVIALMTAELGWQFARRRMS